MEATSSASGAELCLSLLRMVVVRDHDRFVWVISDPKSDGGIDGGIDPNDGVYIRFPIIAEFRGVDKSGERARREQTVRSEIVSSGGGIYSGDNGSISDGICDRDEV